MEKQTAIIGSGPAGLTAAIYLSRANLNPTLYAGSIFGGQLMITTEVDNFPGFPEGIMGPVLMEKMIEQAKKFGTKIVYKDVTKVDVTVRPFKVTVGDTTEEYDAIIIATGASYKKLLLPSEEALIGRGVSYCATCDGAFFRNKVIAVVGGGDSAMEEANFLTRFGDIVYIIHRRDSFRASKFMQQKALENPKIKPIYNSVVEEVIGIDKVTGVRLKNIITNEIQNLSVDGVFVAIGQNPNSTIFDHQIDLNDQGYILTHKGTETNIPGVFSAGEVDDYRYKQAIVAAGDGCKAALDLERYLEGITGPIL